MSIYRKTIRNSFSVIALALGCVAAAPAAQEVVVGGKAY